MRPLIPVVVLLLAGCAAGEQPALDTTKSFPNIVTRSCERPARRNCTFINSPVKLASKALTVPDNPYPYYRTRNRLKFVDAVDRAWVAPAGTWTDGASIPPIFVPFIGDPRSRKFINAATVHDAYCGRNNENGPYYHTRPWQEVHRMLYDGLRVSGTSAIKAKIMYAAVYLGGPRWKELRTPPRRRALRLPASAEGVRVADIREDGASPLVATVGDVRVTAAAADDRPALRRLQADTPLTTLVAEKALIDTFKAVKAWIEANDPSIDEVEVRLTRAEVGLTSGGRTHPQGRNFRPGARDDRGLDGGDGGDGGDNGGDGGNH